MMQQTLLSTKKANYLQSKLVNPEMFYVSDNMAKKDGVTSNGQSKPQDISDMDNEFERDSQQDDINTNSEDILYDFNRKTK